MRSFLEDTCASRNRLLRACFSVATATILLLSQHLQADVPERRMANVDVDDQGNQLVLSWHFFYFLLPPQFILHEKQDMPVSVGTTDAHLLQQNLEEIAQVAFDVKINGQTVQPTLLKVTTFPNQSCLVLLSYPG